VQQLCAAVRDRSWHITKVLILKRTVVLLGDMGKIWNLPNILTLSRIAILPLFIAAFYLSGHWSNYVTLALFVIASVTDFFDGYLARAWKQQSDFGRFLDPVADKLLAACALLMLVHFDRIVGTTVLAAIVILCREILVSGLREFLGQMNVVVHVSKLAKYKTAMQMAALCFLLLGDIPVAGVLSSTVC